MRTTIFSILMAVAMGFVGMTSVQADDNRVQVQNTDQLISATFDSLPAMDDSLTYEILDAKCEIDERYCDEPMDDIGAGEIQLASAE